MGDRKMGKRKLSHVDTDGDAHMVDVTGKAETERYAKAKARVLMSADLLKQLQENTLKKGDALSVARIAGIMAAKKTSDLIPLCHTLPLTHVAVDVKIVEDPPSVEITSEARTHYKTGVEMEALTAASVAALTIYDMGKAVDKGMVIEGIHLVEKSGGKSGTWKKESAD
jgi:cyclic pyranopterin phosphate synthase